MAPTYRPLRYLPFHTFRCDGDEIISTQISPNAKYVVALTRKASVLTWLLQSGRELLPRIASNGNPPLCIAWIADDVFVCGFEDGSLGTFNLHDNHSVSVELSFPNF